MSTTNKNFGPIFAESEKSKTRLWKNRTFLRRYILSDLLLHAPAFCSRLWRPNMVSFVILILLLKNDGVQSPLRKSGNSSSFLFSGFNLQITKKQPSKRSFFHCYLSIAYFLLNLYEYSSYITLHPNMNGITSHAGKREKNAKKAVVLL